MSERTKISAKTQTIVGLSMLTAIIIVMSFTPLGYLRVAVVDITFLAIPVSIGAILYGPKGGALLGLIFGLTSFIQCFGISPLGALIFGISPILTIFVCIVPRFFMGLLDGIIYRAVAKKNKSIAYLVATLAASLLNTVLFTLPFILFFGNNTVVQEAMQTDSVVGVLLTIITFNALIEAGATLIVGSGVAKAIEVVRNHS